MADVDDEGVRNRFFVSGAFSIAGEYTSSKKDSAFGAGRGGAT